MGICVFIVQFESGRDNIRLKCFVSLNFGVVYPIIDYSWKLVLVYVIDLFDVEQLFKTLFFSCSHRLLNYLAFQSFEYKAKRIG